MSDVARLVLVMLAGFLGAMGVALSAVAAHRVEAPALVTAANFMILHAAATIAVSAMAGRCRAPRAWAVAAGLMLAGTTLFASDIALRGLADLRLFPMAAPTGGSLMIAAWLAVAAAAFLELRCRAA